MKFYSNQYLSTIPFLIISFVIYWNPSWLSLMGFQAYWPIIWLLPWALNHGPFKSMLTGFLLGFILDTVNADLCTQIPGLMICGFWFSKVGRLNQFNNSPIQFGLSAAIGSLICGVIYFCQMIVKVLSGNTPLWLFSYGVQIIFAQIFLTSLLAPFFCKWIYLFFRKNKLRL
tara:strand:+ start:276 stop:791 length:516 start_codon:yes stop_codon:yes gene_type:complete